MDFTQPIQPYSWNNPGQEQQQTPLVDNEQLLQILQLLALEQGQQKQEPAQVNYDLFTRPEVATPPAAQTAPPASQLAGVGSNGAGANGAGAGSQNNGTGANNASQGTTDRALDSLGGSLAGLAGKSALGAGLGALQGTSSLGQGFAQGMANPYGLMGMLGDSVYSGLGVTKTPGFLGTAVKMAPSVALGLLGIANPALGIGAALLGTPLSDAFGDVTGMRTGDVARDNLEDALGEIGGRTAFADDMTGIKDKSLLEGATSMQHAADMAAARARTQTLSNVDAIKAAYDQMNAYQSLSDRISKEYGTYGTMQGVQQGLADIGRPGMSSSPSGGLMGSLGDYGQKSAIERAAEGAFGGYDPGTSGGYGSSMGGSALGRAAEGAFGDIDSAFGGYDSFGDLDGRGSDNGDSGGFGDRDGGFGDRDSSPGGMGGV